MRFHLVRRLNGRFPETRTEDGRAPAAGAEVGRRSPAPRFEERARVRSDRLSGRRSSRPRPANVTAPVPTSGLVTLRDPPWPAPAGGVPQGGGSAEDNGGEHQEQRASQSIQEENSGGAGRRGR